MSLTITIPGGPVQLSDTRIRIKVNTDATQGSLYSVLLKVTPADAGTLPGGPFIEEKTPDDNGDAWFEISGLLRRVFVPEFNIVAGTVCTERATTPYKVALDIGETYIDDNSIRQENWAELAGDQYSITLLRGGLSEHRQNIYSQLGTTFYADYIQGGKWLTEMPNPVWLAPDKLAKLHCMTPESEAQELTLVAAYALADGTTGSVSQACTINPGSIHEFDIDPLSLGLDVSSANKVASYSVVLKNGETAVIETFIINLDYETYEESYQAFYMNKFSGVDALWLHGKSEDQFPATHEFANRTPEVGDTSTSRTRVASSKSGRRQWAVNCGYKSYEEILALRSFLLSRQVWLLDDGYAVPVNIENSEEALAKKDNDMHDYQVVFTEAHENSYM